ncbi:MAG: hypothetical protein LPK45_04950, partial [Bacteroidota bacterium]|nr:hypothetical protein [Bacteroidota bacterium]MDX5430407.1 hypothetical protein [Bacteroidota bacterium]MDX5469166.1 hypothetical protein [Bacteroidota bacterium]
RFYLIPGNHDIVNTSTFPENLMLKTNPTSLGGLWLGHAPEDLPENEKGICGHIHPGYRLSGKGRQSLMLPAAYLYPNTLVLPAFGVLTGMVKMPVKKNTDRILFTPQGPSLLSSGIKKAP